MPTSHLSHPKYRPDIDGLRAVAVLSVVAFHAFPDWLKGGFIGVDVFFVISGFLISTIIFENLDRETFSFSEFYARRIKRIFPALLVILIASYALGWFVLLADEYKQLGKHIAAGAGFVSNFVLWGESGYFDNAAETKPLLHLWSLGIEEQFYIVWPFALWLAWKVRFNLLAITVAVTVASFSLNIAGAGYDAVATFYSPQTRFWELLEGSLLAWFTLYKKNAYASLKLKMNTWLAMVQKREKLDGGGETIANILSWLGCLLLAYGYLRIDKHLSFPGYWALLPVLGAALIIAAGSQAWLNRNILSNKLAVWVGLISFPLYLWHWPLLTFARIATGQTPNQSIRIAAVMLSILLAWLTYKLIERPVRFGRHGRSLIVLLITLMAIIGAVGGNTYLRDGLKYRAIVKSNAAIDSGFDGGDMGYMIHECGIDENIRKLFRICAKDRRGNIRFALMGDSKAEALYGGLVRTSHESGRWLFIGGHGPNGAPTPLLAADPDPNRPLTHHAIEAINNNGDIEVVVLVTAIRSLFTLSDGVKNGNFSTYDPAYLRNLSTSPRFDDAFTELNRVVDKFVTRGKKVVLVVDNPALPNPQDCIQRQASAKLMNSGLGKTNPACTIQLDTFNTQIQLYRKLLNEIKSAHPISVDIFDPTDIYCDTKRRTCEATKNGKLMYSYTDHISDYAAGLVGVKLNRFLNDD